MARKAKGRSGNKKDSAPDTDSGDDSSASTPTRPAHLDNGGQDAIQWSRNPDVSNNKVKKKKKKKVKSVDSTSAKTSEDKSVASDSDAEEHVPKPRKKKKKKKKDVAFEWSRVPSSKKLQVDEGFDDDEASLNSSNSRGPVPRENTKSTKRTDDSSNHSRRSVKSSSSHKPMRRTKAPLKTDESSNHSRRSVKSSSSHKPQKKPRSASRLDDSSNHSRRSASSHKPQKKPRSASRLDDSSNHSRRSASSHKPQKKPRSASRLDDSSNHSRRSVRSASSHKPRRKTKSTMRLDDSSNHSRRSVKSSSNHTKPIKRTKSFQSVDSATKSSSSRAATRKAKSAGSTKRDRSARSPSAMRKAQSSRNFASAGSTRRDRSARSMRKAQSTRNVDSPGNYSVDPPTKSTASRKAPKRVKSTESAYSAAEEPSNNSSKSLKETKSTQSVDSSSNHKNKTLQTLSQNLDMIGNIGNHRSPQSPPRPKIIQHVTSDTLFDDASDQSDSDDDSHETSSDDKSVDESTSHRQEEEQGPERTQALNHQSSDDSQSSSEIDYVEESLPKKKFIPKGRQKEPVRVDFAGQILPTSSHESKKSRVSMKSDASEVTSRLRKELEDSYREEFGQDSIEDAGNVARRDRSNSVSSSEQQKHLQSMLKNLENFETNLMEEQNNLELAKQSLESRVFEQVQRQEELKTVRQELEETYHKLQINFPYPVEELQARREELRTENQVLKLRIKRQEDTLEKYQQPKMRNKTREIFRVSHVMRRASLSSVAQSSSASQMRLELAGLKAQIDQKDEIIEEQSKQRDELRASVQKAHNEVDGGYEIRIMQARVTELEKEKEAFMKVIACLREEGKELEGKGSRAAPSREKRRTLSRDEEEIKADMADMKSILESDPAEEADEQNEDPGFLGWLFGAQQS